MLSRGGYFFEALPAMAARIASYQPTKSVLAEIDVSDPKRLRLVRTLTLDGSYVAARLIDGTARIVAASQVPGTLPFVQPDGAAKDELAAATARNRAVVASSRVSSWLPTYRIRRAGAKAGKPRPLVQCRHVRRAASFSGLGMLTVLTVDLAKGLEPVDSVAVMTDGRDRLRLAREPLRRDRALGRPPFAGQARAGRARRHDRHPQVRHLEPGADAVPRQRAGLRLPAQPVVALGASRRPPRRQHRIARLVGRGP